MSLFHHKENFFQPIIRTLFFTAVISFVVFLLLDLLRQGFVSNTFSVHWFLLAALFSGVWWAFCLEKETSQPRKDWLVWFLAVFFAVVSLFVTWLFRVDLGNYLVLILPLALVTPFLVIYLLRR